MSLEASDTGTDDADSCQIIIPQNQVGRKNGECPLHFTQCNAHEAPQTSTSRRSPPLTMSRLKTSGSPLYLPLSRRLYLNERSYLACNCSATSSINSPPSLPSTRPLLREQTRTSSSQSRTMRHHTLRLWWRMSLMFGRGSRGRSLCSRSERSSLRRRRLTLTVRKGRFDGTKVQQGTTS